jgi:hypothetical protein
MQQGFEAINDSVYFDGTFVHRLHNAELKDTFRYSENLFVIYVEPFKEFDLPSNIYAIDKHGVVIWYAELPMNNLVNYGDDIMLKIMKNHIYYYTYEVFWGKKLNKNSTDWNNWLLEDSNCFVCGISSGYWSSVNFINGKIIDIEFLK